MAGSARFTAILDACVLYPQLVRDVLMRLTFAGLYHARWSATIEEEWTRNLLDQSLPNSPVPWSLPPGRYSRSRPCQDAHTESVGWLWQRLNTRRWRGNGEERVRIAGIVPAPLPTSQEVKRRQRPSLHDQRHCDPSDMGKERHKNLELPLSGNAKAAPARRKATAARARTSRRRLLLIDYQSWLTMMAAGAPAAPASEASRADRGSFT